MKFSDEHRQRLIEKYSKQFVINQENSMEMLQSLEDSFNSIGVDGSKYPDIFGGAYIDIQGKLIVCLCKESESRKV